MDVAALDRTSTDKGEWLSFEMFEANRDRLATLCPTCPLFLVLDIDEQPAPQEAYETIWKSDRLRLLSVPSFGVSAHNSSRADNHP